MKYSTLFLDLDGTLVDSYTGIEWALHCALERVLPRCPRVALRELVGPPLPEIFRLYLEQNLEQNGEGQLSASEYNHVIPKLVAVFREYYDGEGAARCEPYPNVCQTLQRLHENGMRQIVVTNKPARPTALILQRLGWREYFQGVFCPDSRIPNFREKVECARYALEYFKLVPHETLFVGDSADDALAASHNELDFAAVLYGYGAAREYSARYSLEDFSQLLSIISGDAEPDTKLVLHSQKSAAAFSS